MKRTAILVTAIALSWLAVGTAEAGRRGNGLGPGQGDSREIGDVGSMREPESSPRNNIAFDAFGADWPAYTNGPRLHRLPEPDLR